MSFKDSRSLGTSDPQPLFGYSVAKGGRSRRSLRENIGVGKEGRGVAGVTDRGD